MAASGLDPEWCAWFAGFCDGEACFKVSTDGSPKFALQLRDDDCLILEEIQGKLGVGSVTPVSMQTEREKGRRVADQTLLLICGPRCCEVVAALDRSRVGSFSSWFAGFCDGEGCFRVMPDGRSSFTLGLRGDDFAVLNKVQAILGVGAVYNESKQYERDRGVNSKDQVRLTVYSSKNLRVIEHLEGRMRSKKRRDFEIWAEAVRASAALNGGRPHPDRKPMMLEYKRRLEEVRKYARSAA